MHTLSVSSLNEQIKTLMESSFVKVLVEGELSRITFHNSGHIYFTLKDSSSAIRCVMFRGNAVKLKFKLKEGLKVLIDGAISVYKPRGEYQINCFMIEPAGHGALALAYEQLKEKLSLKGYFDPAVKKVIAKFPKRIALITSATGAALQDMLRVAQKRYRLVEIDIYDVLVQGESSAPLIANAIKLSDTKGYDAIVISRGGGSIEDLWAFNEEIVADAVFGAKTPIVSAVGHEIDWLISDFVADVRAPTPSAAMEMILPECNELYQTIDALMQQYSGAILTILRKQKTEIAHMSDLYSKNSLQQRLTHKKDETMQLQSRFLAEMQFKLEQFKQHLSPWQSKFDYQMRMIIDNKRTKINSLFENLQANNPSKKIIRGFAQVSKEGKVINLDTLSAGEEFDLMNEKTVVHSKVLETKDLD